MKKIALIYAIGMIYSHIGNAAEISPNQGLTEDFRVPMSSALFAITIITPLKDFKEEKKEAIFPQQKQKTHPKREINPKKNPSIRRSLSRYPGR